MGNKASNNRQIHEVNKKLLEETLTDNKRSDAFEKLLIDNIMKNKDKKILSVMIEMIKEKNNKIEHINDAHDNTIKLYQNIFTDKDIEIQRLNMEIDQINEKSIDINNIIYMKQKEINEYKNYRRNDYKGCIKICRWVEQSVYDGDTAKVVFYDGKDLVIAPFRFYGYDTEEIKQPKKMEEKKRKLLKEIANNQKNTLKSIINNDSLITIVEFMNADKYGRLMGEVYYVNKKTFVEELKGKTITDDILKKYIGDNKISTFMIKKGGAREYYGGKKHKH